MGRAPCCDKANVKRGPWSPDEDELLKTYIQQHGTGGNWISLPPKAGLKRCGKSCRLRWLNYLRPDIRHGGFTEDEDRIICSLYNEIGSRWSVIAAQLQGRTDNDVKNHWNTKLKKKILLSIKEETNSTNQNLITTFARTSTSSHPPYFRSDVDYYRPQYSISQPDELFWDGHGSSSDALSVVHAPIQHPCLGTSSPLGKPLMRRDASSLSYLSSMAMVEEKCASVFPNSIKEEDDNPLIYSSGPGGFGVPYDVLIDGLWSSQAHNKVGDDHQESRCNYSDQGFAKQFPNW